MNVYISRCTQGYGGGCAIVAANSPDEAWELAMQDDNKGYMFSEWDCDDHREKPNPGKYMSAFAIFEGLHYSGDPKVLTIDVYYE